MPCHAMALSLVFRIKTTLLYPMILYYRTLTRTLTLTLP